MLAAVATAVAAGGQPAFAADRPAPSASAKAGHSAGHHATRAKHAASKAAAGKAHKKTESTRASAAGVRPESVGTVTVTPGLGGADVSWTSDNGNGALSYTVTLDNDDATCSVDDPTVSCHLAGVPAGTYTATVTEYDAIGGAGGTGAVVDVPTDSSPFTVDPVTVDPGLTTAVVSWPDGGTSGALSYEVTVDHGGTGCTVDESAGAPSSCNISGLAPSTTYTATVTSYDATGGAGGGGAVIDTADSDTFSVSPVDVTPGATDAVVTWSAVPNAVDYDVTVNHGGTGCTGVTTPLTCTLSDLTTGQTYIATVVANGGGGPLDSTTSDSFTIGTPGSPTFVSPVPGANSIAVSWNAPSDTGAGVDHYVATASPGGLSCPTASASGDTSCTITGLTPGVAYTVTVVAVGNGTSGSSAPSDSTMPVVVGPPPAPTGVTAAPGDGQVTVTWTEDAGFARVDYFTATATPVVGSPPSTPLVCHTPSADFTSCTITGLTDLSAYTVSVAAHGAGDSADSTPSDEVLPLPAAISLQAGANSKWVTAEHAGGSPLIARADTAGAWEKFDVVGNADGTVSLIAHVNGKYVSADHGGAAPLIANRSSAGDWEKFWITKSGTTYALKAKANGMYVTAEGGGAGPLIARASSAGAWESFTVVAAP